MSLLRTWRLLTICTIAEQMLDWKRVAEKDIYSRDITFGVDLILGGGRKVFTGNNARVLSKAIDMGYTYTTNMTEFLADKGSWSRSAVICE